MYKQSNVFRLHPAMGIGLGLGYGWAGLYGMRRHPTELKFCFAICQPETKKKKK